LLTPHAPRLASISLAPRRVCTVRWQAHAHCVAMTSTLPVQLTTLTPAYGQSSCPRVPLTTPVAALAAHCAARAHARSAAEPSPPSLSPCAGPRCFYVIRNYKRDIPRAFCLCPHHCLPPVSRRRCTASVFHRSVGAKLSHPTSPPCTGPGASLSVRSYFPNQEGDTFTVVELRHR
jgi:hypothetical protein